MKTDEQESFKCKLLMFRKMAARLQITVPELSPATVWKGGEKKPKQALGERQAGRPARSCWRHSVCVCAGVCVPACGLGCGGEEKEDEGEESCASVRQPDSFPNCYGDPQIFLLLIALDNFNVTF